MNDDCFCDYNPPAFYRRETPKARKPYRCEECSGYVAVGETFERVVGLWEGSFWTFITCERCIDLRTWVRNTCALAFVGRTAMATKICGKLLKKLGGEPRMRLQAFGLGFFGARFSAIGTIRKRAMVSLELAALRKRARAAGIAPGIVARAQRAKEAHQAEWHASCAWPFSPPPAPRLIDPSPIDFEGVSRWVVAICKPSMARSVGEDLPALGFRTYCPLGRRVVLRARGPGGTRRRRIHQWAVFGRYLFVAVKMLRAARGIHPLKALSMSLGIAKVLGRLVP